MAEQDHEGQAAQPATALGEDHGAVAPDPAPAADPAAAEAIAPARGRLPSRTRLWALLGAGIAVVLLGAAVAIKVLGVGAAPPAPEAASPSASQSAAFGPAVVDLGTLAATAQQVGHPVYWAGAPKERLLELTVGADDATVVRYLADGGPTTPADALTVAMYPLPDAYAQAERAAATQGAMSRKVAGDLIVGNSANPYNSYLASPDLPYLIEVFDPTPGRAWKLLVAGKVLPVPASAG